MRNGIQVYGRTCTSCRKLRVMRWYNKKTHCEKCGFVPVHPVQLDVDHIDGNHTNNSRENLMTLCANCHRLKTIECKDYEILAHNRQPRDTQPRLFE